MRKILAAGFGLALALTFSCSDSGSDEVSRTNVVTREKISGVSQKGPFAKGTKVKIYELDENLEKTSKYFDGKTSDDEGNFEISIEKGELTSPYVIVEVKGNYANEVTGKKSDGTVTLSAIADVSGKNTVNINVLTHLELEKVIKLAKAGTKFDKAKETAQKEVFDALGISNSQVKNSEDLSIFSDSLLLMASILLQGTRSTDDVSDLLAEFSKEIKENGVLKPETKADLASGLAGVDMDKVKNNLPEGAKMPSYEYIKDIVTKIDSASAVPPEKPSSSSTEPSSSSEESSGSADISSSSSREEPALSSNSAEISSSGREEPSSSSSTLSTGDTFIDTRDKKSYKIAVIGTQVWMAENLNYNEKGSMCYEDSDDYCNKYGRLYDLATAKVSCPSGWHLPSTDEWKTLIKFVDKNSSFVSDTVSTNAGKYLKAKEGWSGQESIGQDLYGFSAMPGGFGLTLPYSSSSYEGGGSLGSWWSDDSVLSMEADNDGLLLESIAYYEVIEELSFSVRCVSDK